MAYSLLAHLYPRIKGSQEDVATYSLVYILEQSTVLNEAFTRLISQKFGINQLGTLQYNCQDADSEYGRPDIAGYKDGRLFLLCEAKFFAGLTENQPVSYITRLQKQSEGGLIFICPQSRIISLWDKLCELAEEAGLQGELKNGHCIDYSGIRMSIISWNEIVAELMRTAIEQDPERQGDIRQLQGFCEKMESEAFIPFRPEDFGTQIARNIDRYYEVVDEVHKLLRTNKLLGANVKGLRKAPKVQGYSQYIVMDGFGISIDYNRELWKAPTSIETPFWFYIKEINENNEWIESDRIKRYQATLDSKICEENNWATYIALIPKPFITLEELANDMADQIIKTVQKIREMK